jgi:hypothetical protein
VQSQVAHGVVLHEMGMARLKRAIEAQKGFGRTRLNHGLLDGDGFVLLIQIFNRSDKPQTRQILHNCLSSPLSSIRRSVLS